MFKSRSHVPGTAPATLTPHLVDGKAIPPTMTLFEYDEHGSEERKLERVEEAFHCFDNDKVSWINIDGLGDVEVLRKLGERFNLHPLALEDVLNVGQRPKVEHYEGYIFIVMEMIYLNQEQEVRGEQVSMFLGKNFLITVQEEAETDAFEPVRQRIRSGRGWIRKMKCDYLAYALLDSVIDHYFPVLENVGSVIEEIENTMVEKPSRDCLLSLHDYKRTLLQMRRFVWPAREVTTALMHEETGIVRPETKVFLRDCYDHTVQVMDLVESYRDVVSGLMELYLSSIGMRTNEIMRVLTVMSSIFIPLTFIAGVYGMNFASADGDRQMPLNMPELHSPYGYVGVWITMIVIAVGQILFFKHKKWL